MGRDGLRRRHAEDHPRKCGGNRKQRRFHRLSPSDVPTGRYSEIIIGVVGIFHLKLRTLTFFIRVSTARAAGACEEAVREQPETARIPARAEAMLDLDRVTCQVRSWAGETAAGLHPAAGGDGSFACSADMLLEALVACAGVTISALS